jgi:hypothetical protein
LFYLKAAIGCCKPSSADALLLGAVFGFASLWHGFPGLGFRKRAACPGVQVHSPRRANGTDAGTGSAKAFNQRREIVGLPQTHAEADGFILPVGIIGGGTL